MWKPDCMVLILLMRCRLFQVNYMQRVSIGNNTLLRASSSSRSASVAVGAGRCRETADDYDPDAVEDDKDDDDNYDDNDDNEGNGMALNSIAAIIIRGHTVLPLSKPYQCLLAR